MIGREAQARKDALADAETLRRAWAQFLGWSELHSDLGTFAKAGFPIHDGFADDAEFYAARAQEAARAAFRAVPELRGDR
jgi:hypothetical protein